MNDFKFPSRVPDPFAKGPQGLFAQAIDLVLLPLRVAVSPLARRAYLSGFLLFLTSFFLLFLSSVAYVLFYYAYVPHAAVSVPVYLQYSHGAPASGDGSIPVSRPASHPFGTALLAPSLSSNQKYDVEVVLDMPLSPVNKAAGNFMVQLEMLAPVGTVGTEGSTRTEPGVSQSRERAAQSAVQYAGGSYGSADADSSTEVEAVVVRARRPTILQYTSRHISLLRQMVALPWYAFGWVTESQTLSVGMLEDVEFVVPRTRRLRSAVTTGVPGVPDRVRVTVESREMLEVYSIRVEIRARLRGLRWLMYRYKIASFFMFTGGFFVATMGSAVAIFIALTIRQVMNESDWNAAGGGLLRIKEEEEEERDQKRDGGIPTIDPDDGLSDTPRQFPTAHGKEPLRYPGRGRQRNDEGEDEPVIKQEEEDDLEDVAAAAAADVEDEGDYEDAGVESFRDSGIGTGVEDRDSALTRRRKRLSGVER